MSDTRLVQASAALALAGLGIAAYLAYTHYSRSSIACPTSGCETVQSSSYATIAGAPVALLGLIGYLVILVGLALPRESGRTIVLAASLAGSLFSLYLLAVQAFEIHAFCAWCVASDVLVLALAGLSLTAFLRAPDAAENP
jgi:uncharacterized membrane protein